MKPNSRKWVLGAVAFSAPMIAALGIDLYSVSLRFFSPLMAWGVHLAFDIVLSWIVMAVIFWRAQARMDVFLSFAIDLMISFLVFDLAVALKGPQLRPVLSQLGFQRLPVVLFVAAGLYFLASGVRARILLDRANT